MIKLAETHLLSCVYCLFGHFHRIDERIGRWQKLIFIVRNGFEWFLQVFFTYVIEIQNNIRGVKFVVRGKYRTRKLSITRVSTRYRYWAKSIPILWKESILSDRYRATLILPVCTFHSYATYSQNCIHEIGLRHNVFPCSTSESSTSESDFGWFLY